MVRRAPASSDARRLALDCSLARRRATGKSREEDELQHSGRLTLHSLQALDWLYANYWLPALNSSSATSTLAHALPPLPLSTLRPLLLTTYKSLAKQITRDASIAGRLKADVQKAYKDVERWIVENSLGGGLRGGKKEEEARERALEAVAEVLWEEGGLVPLAKKYVQAPLSAASSLILTSSCQETPDDPLPRPPCRAALALDPAPRAL